MPIVFWISAFLILLLNLLFISGISGYIFVISVFSFSGIICVFIIDIFLYLSIFSWGLVIFIGNSTDKTPSLTNIISSTISLSFIKISFLSAITGLKTWITLTIKSVFWKFLKKTKFFIIGLYISHIKSFLRLIGRQSNIIFFNCFSWKFLNFKYLIILSYNSSGKFWLFNLISSKISFFFSKSTVLSLIFLI